MTIVNQPNAAADANADKRCGDILIRIDAGGIHAVPFAMERLAALGFTTDDPRTQAVTIEVLSLLLAELRKDLCSGRCDSIFPLFAGDLGMAAANLLFQANFPTGGNDLSLLSDGTVICIAGLLEAADHADDALALLDQAQEHRPDTAFAAAADHARARIRAEVGYRETRAA